jgi:uracil-DNA glycosylase
MFIRSFGESAEPPWPLQLQGIASVTSTDEIYERYLQKAIVEINDLAHEVAQAGGNRVPVVGSGHPLADVMLLKYRPQAAEVQEGVAFYGRAGQAILKSLQRLHVDPMAVYGTNCLKFADGSDDESRAFLTRELHIVQPKLVVPMGETSVEFLNSLEFPLADAIELKPGELQRFTATTQALVVPDIDASLDEAPAKTQFWNAFKPLGTWWAELPPY